MLFKTFSMMTLMLMVTAMAGLGCESVDSMDTNELDMLEQNAQMSVRKFKQQDPSMDRFFSSSAGYAVFPTVGKGGAGVGGAHGNGVVYQGGRIVGYTELAQGTIGLQLGGQAYSEIIFFETSSDLNHFKTGNMEFSAQASAVAATAGASANVDYERGVAVFTMAKGGLMAEASVGGQKFDYSPKR